MKRLNGGTLTAVPLDKGGVDVLHGRPIDGEAKLHISSNPQDTWFSRSEYPPVSVLIIDDIRNWTWAEIREILAGHGAPTDINCVFGGPPCQGFSTAGKREVMDPRNSLLFEFGRMIQEIQPDSCAMENVPGLVNMRTPWGESVLDAFTKMLEDSDYYSQITAFQALGPEPVMLSTKKRPATEHEQAESTKSGFEQLQLFGDGGEE